MTRIFQDESLVIASRNQGKIKEITALLSPYVAEIKNSADFDLEDVAETGTTFFNNASLKALYTARETGLPSLADDSGLMVYALGGQPGVYTADWAGADRNYQSAMQRIINEIGDNPNHAAQFVCTLVLAWPDSHVESVSGAVKGQIVWPPRGDLGFGYDPFFVPDGQKENQAKTFAEMTIAEKQSYSHRADAFQKLVDLCFKA